MRAIIAEDERHLAEDLRRRLTHIWPELDIAAVLHDGAAASAALATLKPELAFLDIRMPGRSGLEVAAAAPDGCRVVFVTAYDDHAVQAFEQAAVDFLLKPVSDVRLSRCVERLKKQSVLAPAELLAGLQSLLTVQSKPQYLRWIKAQVGQNVRLVAVEEVSYFQSTDKYTTAVTQDAALLLRTSLKDLLSQLDPAEFWRVHRSTVVNVRQIVSAHHTILGKITLSLRSRSEKIPVSQTYAHLFRQM